jgi:NhaA family Na+:H+ antiporter
VLLLAIAIIDDIGAILVIAIFYTAEVSLLSLALAAGGAVVLVALNASGVTRIAPYVLVGVVLWVCVLKSGVHATLAGVVTALAVPLRGDGRSPLKTLEHMLHPWVAFMILPLFAFANAGLALDDLQPADLLDPLPIGIALGLVIGKQVGVFLPVLLAVRAGVCRMPEGVDWHHVYGLGCLTGIGFTMSLFIGTLAYGDARLDAVRLGVLAGSLLSGLLGAVVLGVMARRPSPATGAGPVV